MKKEGPGPSGDVPDTARHRALSAASRVRMLDLVRRAEDGMTAAEVVAATGLHPSTVRAHLEQLVRSGLLERHRRSDGSPGRPAWRYRPAHRPDDADAHAAGVRGPYQELAATLVAQLARDADDPHATGVRAGRDWGRALAAPLTASGTRPVPLDGLIQVLERLGFTPYVADQPSPGTAVVHLRSCPFLDLALAHPDVVCGVHQGVIDGVLGVLGASAVRTDLEPFAIPGACLVRVRVRPGPALAARPGRGHAGRPAGG